ncbi:sensor histidine kinase, partial [Streptomyces sp. SID3343]|uniref:histidine kinase n=1 Tax=Streptomyces sp. SID3343 TaxID=2690260 RepID=UPI00136AC388|nr:sensor histidine kinase [Streptomyces sp. SID3343]
MQVLTATVVAHSAFLVVVTPNSHSYGGAMAVALYTVARSRGVREIAAAAGACLVVQFARSLYGETDVVVLVLGDAATTALLIGAGLGVARWEQQRAANRRLLEDRAVAEERRRIARELHDVVSHHITTMNVMSGGARSTMTQAPDSARAALITLEKSGRAALGEMRQLLGVLRSTDTPEKAPSEPQPGMDDIDRLIAQSRAAGLTVAYEEVGEPRPLPPTAGLTLYRIVQEALTNTRKHAGDARASVQVRHLPDGVTVEVLDDGAGGSPSAGLAGSGYGLTGMRERVALHDGTLETGHRPG